MCVESLIRVHSLILWIDFPLEFAYMVRLGKLKELLFHLCNVYRVCGDVLIEAHRLILWSADPELALTEWGIHLCKGVSPWCPMWVSIPSEVTGSGSFRVRRESL